MAHSKKHSENVGYAPPMETIKKAPVKKSGKGGKGGMGIKSSFFTKTTRGGTC